MNIFELAELELIREGKNPADNLGKLLDRAITIRKFLNKHRQITVNKILAGGVIYNYGNRIIVNNR